MQYYRSLVALTLVACSGQAVDADAVEDDVLAAVLLQLREERDATLGTESQLDVESEFQIASKMFDPIGDIWDFLDWEVSDSLADSFEERGQEGGPFPPDLKGVEYRLVEPFAWLSNGSNEPDFYFTHVGFDRSGEEAVLFEGVREAPHPGSYALRLKLQKGSWALIQRETFEIGWAPSFR